MCSGAPRRLCRAALLVCLLLIVAPALASPKAWLLTYGPGEVYWERFGHNAIWLQDPAQGLDHSFNFGFFDFGQSRFLLRFVQGRMLYFAAAVPVERELDYYRRAGREIRVQALDLDPAQYARLRDHLLRHVQPEHREYLYDYYLDNCSTRVRDALDVALQGALEEQFRPQPGLQTFRDHTRRSTAIDYWYHWGLETGLGMPADRPISRWEEMFLPAVLADSLAEVTVPETGGLRPLLASDERLEESRLPLPPATPPLTWPRYLGLGLGLALFGWLLARLAPPVLADALMQAWMLNASVMGLVMLGLWLGTDHQAARPNANLLLLNPLMFLALLPSLRRPAAVVVAVGVLLAVMVLGMSWLQDTRDVAALLIPVHLACAWRLWRHPAPRPGLTPARAGPGS